MSRVRDLTEIINEQHRRFYMGRPLIADLNAWTNYGDQENPSDRRRDQQPEAIAVDCDLKIIAWHN